MSEERHAMTNDGWLDVWKHKPNPPWAMKGVNPYIQKYRDDLTKCMECAKVFFPMCGDVPDMSWLAAFGHTVVGIELSQVAVEKFFIDNQIEYDVKPLEKINGSLYTSKKGNIRIYCGDFFLFDSSLEKDFDGIWDRGSFNILDDADLKKKYVEIIKSVMKLDCKIILEFVIVEDEKGQDADDIKQLYGANYDVKDLGLVERYAPEYTDIPIKGFQFFFICGTNNA